MLLRFSSRCKTQM
uniref:Uncharacterized protein n=1 Tax=Arundo donax TaxID=35708 RepID=A0A0A9PXH3_ARUDO